MIPIDWLAWIALVLLLLAMAYGTYFGMLVLAYRKGWADGSVLEDRSDMVRGRTDHYCAVCVADVASAEEV